jgi:hypothetical protein
LVTSGFLGVNYRRGCVNYDQKIGWAAFWAILSQTHPVTLSHSPQTQLHFGLSPKFAARKKSAKMFFFGGGGERV